MKLTDIKGWKGKKREIKSSTTILEGWQFSGYNDRIDEENKIELVANEKYLALFIDNLKGENSRGIYTIPTEDGIEKAKLFYL